MAEPLDHDSDEFTAGADLISACGKAAGLEIVTVYRARRLDNGDVRFGMVVHLKRDEVIAAIAAARAEAAATRSFNPDTIVVDLPTPGAAFAAARSRLVGGLRELDAEVGRLSRDEQRQLWDWLLGEVGERLVKTGGQP